MLSTKTKRIIAFIFIRSTLQFFFLIFFSIYSSPYINNILKQKNTLTKSVITFSNEISFNFKTLFFNFTVNQKVSNR